MFSMADDAVAKRHALGKTLGRREANPWVSQIAPHLNGTILMATVARNDRIFSQRETRMKKLVATAAALLVAAQMASAAERKVVFHVDENDPAVMNLALNNAQNVATYYKAKGDTVKIEVVAYGPGLTMLIADKSPVAQRISAMSLENPDITFDACGNTMAKMKEKTGAEVVLLPEAVVVPAGVVRLMELQDAGYAYIRP
jgi:intracellular sulfur oxidation DsrE/DsrF family protein